MNVTGKLTIPAVALSITAFLQSSLIVGAQQGKYVSIYAKQEVPTNLAHFRDSAVNFEFDYPKVLNKVADSEKDLIVKLDGVIDQKHVEVKLSKLEGVTDLRVAEQIISSNFQKGLPGCKPVSRRDVRFGKGFALIGTEQVFNFKVGDELYAARLVLFSNREQTYMFSFIGSVSDNGVAKSVFEQVVASIRQQSPYSVASRSTDSGSLSFTKYSDAARQVSFDYPQGWKLERDPGKEFELKFRGANKSGLGGELVVTRLERNPAYTLDQFFETYEQTYLKPLPNYQKLSTTHTSFGVTRHDGSLTSSTFTSEGHQFRHLTAFFAEGKYYYAVALTGGIWSESEMRNVFDRILASFKVTE
ncbi:MAG: hypothetical protein U0103_28620 [Candidatus Obscuribacterales bacterium]